MQAGKLKAYFRRLATARQCNKSKLAPRVASFAVASCKLQVPRCKLLQGKQLSNSLRKKIKMQ